MTPEHYRNQNVVQNSDFLQILEKTKICTRGLNMANRGKWAFSFSCQCILVLLYFYTKIDAYWYITHQPCILNTLATRNQPELFVEVKATRNEISPQPHNFTIHPKLITGGTLAWYFCNFTRTQLCSCHFWRRVASPWVLAISYIVFASFDSPLTSANKYVLLSSIIAAAQVSVFSRSTRFFLDIYCPYKNFFRCKIKQWWNSNKQF